ncbi:aspartate aminotransferase family protein [Haliangium ochraceum]|uniref:Acetylornithine transaminase n=1 Tax=Haliangium ochraceum (strain DSM 14365 / JCM 11303 / SMP-2) TaxID=502025 RepID=D0LLI5_HALO1|nr:aspartate aminotransferase family protein [Haliangium ochraceum]ACY13202.1 Acetylornithine transaminase [Haliangium ochraceum DSM 14365]
MRRVDTPVPGPRSRELIDDLARYECPAITARRARRSEESGVDQDPIVWRRGQGAYIEDVDGNRYLDFTAAFAVSGYGHAHPELVAALSAQAEQLMHGMGDVYPTDVKIAFARALAKITPGALERSIFAQSGADAVEAALKTAAVYSGRRRVLAFHGGYHGLSLGALAVTAYRDSFREPFHSALNHLVTHAPYPNCYRCPFGKQPQSCDTECLRFVRHLLEHPAAGSEGTGAVIVEPIQGRGGCVVPPAGWLEGLAELCRERDLVLIFDEIYTGFARTGKRFAMEHSGVVPDVACLGKGMAGGFPMSAAIGTPKVMDAWGASAGEAIHTGTFLGNPMGCAVGLKAIELLERERYEERAATLGEHLRAGLVALAARFPERLGEVRGRGLMQAVELIASQHSRAPDGALAVAVMRAMLERGVLLLPSGVYGNVLSFTPPFVVTADEIDEMLGVLADALGALGAS